MFSHAERVLCYRPPPFPPPIFHEWLNSPPRRTRGPLAIYTGLPTAVFGAMPSSALYFGTYEAVKSRLLSIAARVCFVNEGGATGGDRGGDLTGNGGEGLHPLARAGAHALAAACGNAASSLLFVPKEYVKQKIQVQSRLSRRAYHKARL